MDTLIKAPAQGCGSLKVRNFGKLGWPDIRFLVSIFLTKIPTCWKFQPVGFVPVLRGKTNMLGILVSELLTKNWITIRFIFSSSDVDWHLDQPIKRQQIGAHKICENPIVASIVAASFYHYLTASWATKKPYQSTTWRSSWPWWRKRMSIIRGVLLVVRVVSASYFGVLILQVEEDSVKEKGQHWSRGSRGS